MPVVLTLLYIESHLYASAVNAALKLVTKCQFVTFNCRHVCMCVFSVFCSSKEWETSEYSDSLCRYSRANAACHLLLGKSVHDVVHPSVSGFRSPVASLGFSPHWLKSSVNAEELLWPSPFSSCMCFFSSTCLRCGLLFSSCPCETSTSSCCL